MKKTSFFIGLAAVSTLGLAQESGRVISSTPVIQQVAVPRQVCSNEQVIGQAPTSGAGAVVGAIAGGAMGNAVGNGSGRAVATLIGLVGGAMVGNSIEGGGQRQVQNVQQCNTQTFYENRAVAYNVVYEFAGKQYSVQMPNDPGPYVRLQITPVGGSVQPPPAAPVPIAPQTYLYEQPTTVESAVVVAPAYGYAPVAPVVYSGGYYARPYYPPVGVSLNFGYYGGYRGHGGHRHWR
jgi:uncharacterized protein YcfJ